MARQVGFGADDLAHQRNEVLLDGGQGGLLRGVAGGGLRQPQSGVEFVEAADRLDLRMILRHALPEEQAGRAVVAGAGGN